MKKIFVLIILFNALLASAQNVGIGTSNPSNKLHVAGGFRLDTLMGVNGAGLLWHNPNGVVYGIKFTDNINDVLLGDGTFGPYNPAINGALGWLLTGNSGTNPVNNFIGTTDEQPLIFKVNNIPHGYLANNIFLGGGSGLLNTGIHNIGLGNGTLGKNTMSQTIGIGDSSLFNNGVEAIAGSIQGTDNLGIGTKSLFANTIGWRNTAIGFGTLRSNIQGQQNIAIGYEALSSNVTGHNNVALGSEALQLNTNSANTAIGYKTLQNTTSGNWNTAVGYITLNGNSTGENNTAMGSECMVSNRTGSNNCAIGFAALYSNNSGHSNVAIGASSLLNNRTQSNLVAVGDSALFSSREGVFNTAVGSKTLFSNTSGAINTALGYRALFNNISGTSNTAVGMNAMLVLTSGHWNTSIGTLAGPSVNNLLNTSCIGFNSQINISNAMSFGNTNVNRWVFGRLNNTAGVFQVGSDLTNGNGAYLTAGGIWTSTSDENVKENFTALNSKEVLEKISALYITQWNFKSTPVKETHIGPMAQQFKQLFNLGIDGEDKSISTIDPAGIALVGIQQLHKEIKEQQVIIEKQQNLINDLSKRVEALEKK